MKKVISVRFKENGKSYYFDPAGPTSKPVNTSLWKLPAASSAARWCRG